MADSFADHLLPPNATAAERSVAAATLRVPAIPAPVNLVKRPFETPAAFVPFVGWEYSTDIWEERWSEHRKRRVVARSIALHRLKGTAAGIRAHVALTDARVLQLVTPPQGIFLSRTLSKAEMDAWLRTMPQIRVYLAREVGEAKGLDFWGRGFLGHAFLRFDAGRGLYGRAARLWDRGTETRLRIVDLTTTREERSALRIERVSIPGRAGPGAFLGRSYFGHAYLGTLAEAPRLVTWRQDVTYEHSVSALSLASAHPGFDPVDVRSERVSETGSAGPYAYFGRFFGHCFFGADRAAWLMHDRIVLHNPARAAPRVRAWSFWNRSRFGLAAFTAKGVIDLRDTVRRPAFVFGRHFGATFWCARDLARAEAARRAVQVSKSARDRILTTSKLTRPRSFADGIPLDGTARLGDRVAFRL